MGSMCTNWPTSQDVYLFVRLVCFAQSIFSYGTTIGDRWTNRSILQWHVDTSASLLSLFKSISSGSKPPPSKPPEPPRLVTWCNVTEKEAVSALNRATTVGCKQQIVDAHCLQQKGLLFPKVRNVWKCFVALIHLWKVVHSWKNH